MSGTLLGALMALLGGLSMGSGAWTLKATRRCRFENWLFGGMLMGLVVLPWTVTLIAFPGAISAASRIPTASLALSNLFALGWGAANILCAVAFTRIGVALTGSIVGGLGMAMGVLVPMVFKGSGLFASAPDLGSSAGVWVIAAVVMLLGGVALAARAGLGREAHAAARSGETAVGFRAGLLMAIAAGILSSFPNFAFAYGQDAILRGIGAGQHDVCAAFPVWAFGMAGGAAANLGYAAWLLTTGRTWRLFASGARDLPIIALGGLHFAAALALLGLGSLMLGALGASVGWGVYQAAQIAGGQGVGFISGEWRGAPAGPRRLMACAIALLGLAVAALALANSAA